MKKLTLTLIVLAAILVLANLAFARSTPEQAKSLVQEAAAFYQAQGKDATLKELNNPQGKFVRGDLYVFAYALKRWRQYRPSPQSQADRPELHRCG